MYLSTRAVFYHHGDTRPEQQIFFFQVRDHQNILVFHLNTSLWQEKLSLKTTKHTSTFPP